MKGHFKAGDVKFKQILKKIKILILDVDGVLTDGKLFWVNGQGWTRFFNINDGYGIRLLMKAGIQVAVLSGSDSVDIRERMKALNIEKFYLGNEDKLKSLTQLMDSTQFSLGQAAFMGDDLFDIPVLEKVGLAVTVPHASDEVKKSARFITRASGGAGAVREIADALLKAQKK